MSFNQIVAKKKKKSIEVVEYILGHCSGLSGLNRFIRGLNGGCICVVGRQTRLKRLVNSRLSTGGLRGPSKLAGLFPWIVFLRINRKSTVET